MTNPFTDQPYNEPMFDSMCVAFFQKDGKADIYDFNTKKKITSIK